jgi:nitrite reductase/ring-hydroxylating ferredoxin subunit
MALGEFVRVMNLADLREGRMKSCVIGEREIVVCNVKGQIYALDNVCTHALARMSEGRLKGTKLICPMHGAAFDIRSGAVLSSPAAQPLAAHAARVIDGAIEVALDQNPSS